MKSRHFGPDRVIRAEIVVPASEDEVWRAWTTPQGITSFFAPDCHVELRVDGPYEIYFDPQASPGLRGAEGARILAIQAQRMVAFTWNAPPHLASVRQQWTHVVVRLQPLDNDHTCVTVCHDGWGEGEQWDDAFRYFDRAWKEIVLPRLRYRFAVGPVDWSDLPRL